MGRVVACIPTAICGRNVRHAVAKMTDGGYVEAEWKVGGVVEGIRVTAESRGRR